MSKPNVIVIMTDQQKSNSMQLYGEQGIETPSLGKMAEEGILYNNAFTPHPLCVPARVALWTSRFPHNNGCRRNETLMKENACNAFKIWKEEGFKTALIGKNHCFDQFDYENTFDTWLTLNHAGMDKRFPYKGSWFCGEEAIQRAYDELKSIPRKDTHLCVVISDEDPRYHSTGLVGEQTLRFIEENKDEPFAMWVSFPCPHEPYITPRKYADMVEADKMAIPPFDKELLAKAPKRMQDLYKMLNAEGREEELRKVIQVYYANVRFIDDMVGAIMNKLDELKLSENTIVVFTSDHGDFCGEHNMTVKGGVFYDCLVKVPLLMKWKGHLPSGIREKSFVNLIDIVPTLFSLQGIDIPDEFMGRPMPPLEGAVASDAAFSEYGCGFKFIDSETIDRAIAENPQYSAVIKTLSWREAEGRRKMVRTAEWKYVHDPMGDLDELYDMINDPFELKNLIEDSKYTDVIKAMKDMLLKWSFESEDTYTIPFKDINTLI